MRTALIVLLVAVGLLLLIACANVGNLILARSTARRRELAIRAALGAGRWRLVRQMLAESLCLASLGGVAALALCLAITKTLRTSLPPVLMPAGEIRVDMGVLCFGLIVAMAAGLLSGLAPALLVAGGKMHDWLAGSSRSATGSGTEVRTRSVLVAAEVSLTLILLIGAGLLLRSFVRLMDVDPGFKPGHVSRNGLPSRGSCTPQMSTGCLSTSGCWSGWRPRPVSNPRRSPHVRHLPTKAVRVGSYGRLGPRRIRRS